MKKKLILLPFIGILGYVVLSGSSGGPGMGGYGDRTGATLSSLGCGSGCHANTATATTAVTVQLYDVTGTTLITTGYVGGTSYKIRIGGVNNSTTVTNLKRFGFQMSVVKTSSTSTNEGTLSAVTGAHMGTYGSINIVEHSSPLSPSSGVGGTGTVYTIPDIPWTAPVAGSGSVTIFAVINAVNFNTSQDVGDLWNNNFLNVPEASSGVSPITGTLTVCVGATTPLTDASAGGTWSSSNTSIAKIGSTGIVSGVAAGTATITYNDGGTGNATATVTVSTVPAPVAITGPSVVCISTHIILSDATPGGIWSSSTTASATAGSSTGAVTGVAVGTTTITYTVTNSCGTGTSTHTVTVKTLGGTCVSGVAGAGNPVLTELKVYPNPNFGTFTLDISSENNEPATVFVTNIVGQKVKEFTAATNQPKEIMLDQPAGIYFITAATSEGIFVSRVMIQ
jgi:uncharacterized protein YjdB